MLTRRSTVAIVLLFAAGSLQAHAATKAHAIHKARAGHVAASVFSVPLLAQSPLNWGQDPAAASAAVSLQPPASPVSELSAAYRHARGFVAPDDAKASRELAAQFLADDTADTVAGLRDALVDLA